MAKLKPTLSNKDKNCPLNNHMLMNCPTVSKLEAEIIQLKEFIEETDNLEAYTDWCNCNA